MQSASIAPDEKGSSGCKLNEFWGRVKGLVVSKPSLSLR